jgi:uncharacterized protein (DUF1330 family)
MVKESRPGGWSALLEGVDLEQPVGMLNQLRFNLEAKYAADSGEEPCSGAEAYQRYGAATMPILQRIGAQLLLTGTAELIGPPSEWDMTFVVRYRRGADLIDMLRSKEYQASMHHRAAAVADSRLHMMHFCGEGAVLGQQGA